MASCQRICVISPQIRLGLTSIYVMQRGPTVCQGPFAARHFLIASPILCNGWTGSALTLNIGGNIIDGGKPRGVQRPASWLFYFCNSMGRGTELVYSLLNSVGVWHRLCW